MSSANILILEDDLQMRSLLVRGLREEGYPAEGVGSGAALLDWVQRAVPDAFIVDIGLPDADGRDVCRALRARGVTAPVLFLTARSALDDRLSGFGVGGDDYLAKPFALAEIVARLRALLRRAGPGTVKAGAVEIDPAAHTLVAGARSVPLTPTELRIAVRLARDAGTDVTRDELIAAAWPDGVIVNPNTLDAYIGRLRRKLEGLGGGAVILTVHGLGYRFK